ncbi:MAG: hypothetical protein PHD48_02265 [Alphaproteobacteria bacterium]|nr:hypothetical protein [Alphaproteobacteria bacterium]
MSIFRWLKILKRNDPAHEMDDLRMMTLRNRIVAQARVTPQQDPTPAPRSLWQPSKPSFRWGAELALGAALLVLGLWVGQSLNGDSRQEVVAQIQSEQQISVIAMATPWEGWIEEGE